MLEKKGSTKLLLSQGVRRIGHDLKKSNAFTILVSGRNRESVESLQSIIESIPQVEVAKRLIQNGHSDPLHGLEELPDLLIFWIGEQWRLELEALLDTPEESRPAVIIAGDVMDKDAFRLAMKVGAIDFLTPPFNLPEISAAIEQLRKKGSAAAEKEGSVITSVINAKGGAGGSLIVSNLAHILALQDPGRVALIDADVQFGSLAHYFDLKPRYGLLQALEHAYELDKVALEGYMLKHSSGLRLLDVHPEELRIPEEIHKENLDILLQLLESQYKYVFIDLPRNVDAFNSMVMERSDNILVVVQQSIAHLRDAKRLLRLMINGLGIDKRRLQVVINRYDKKSELQPHDIAKALDCDCSIIIPNAFQQVSESVNQGIPLYELAPKSRISKALLEIGAGLSGKERTRPRSRRFFDRIFSPVTGV